MRKDCGTFIIGKTSVEYEININASYASEETDEWGAAFVWVNGNHGVEYNFCYDSGECCSAIYKTGMNYKHRDYPDGYMETDYSTFEHYEIDFSNEDWMLDLIREMVRVAKQFWKEDFE